MNNLSVKERPILFSAPMVRALLDGSKTQTRRMMTPQPVREIAFVGGVNRPTWIYKNVADPVGWLLHKMCPYGRPGDRLWVRESYADAGCRLTYRADLDDGAHCMVKKWTPSIHMFRADSRILLEIVSVRVERLNMISEADAVAEGIPEDGTPCPRCNSCGWVMEGGDAVECNAKGCGDGAVDEYRTLWESINGDGSWSVNPWVWVVEFKRVQP